MLKMEGGGIGWKVMAACTVLVLGFVGGTTVYTAMAQSALEPRVKAIENEVAQRAKAVQSVAVIENELSHLNEKMDANDGSHKAIIEQMKEDRAQQQRDKREILEAINSIRNRSGGR
jgi:hypothetical protein